MASLYILSDEHIKTGQRPKTPRKKQLFWKPFCIILISFIILENLLFLYEGIK